MAVANTKSTIVANADAQPAIMNSVLLAGGREKVQKATVEVLATDDNLSKYRMCRVHSSWSIHSIEIYHDAITGGTQFNVGLYQTDENGGGSVDHDVYGSVLDFSSAAGPVEFGFEARNIDKMENQVWQDGGLSADPDTFYDLVVQAAIVGTAAGTISVILKYTDGS